MKKQVIRVKKNYFVLNMVTDVLFVAAAIYVGYILYYKNAYPNVWMFIGFGVMFLTNNVLPSANQKIVLDQKGIKVSGGKKGNIRLRWEDIKALRMDETKEEMMIGTHEQNSVVSLRYFDQDFVYQAIMKNLEDDVLDLDAFDNLRHHKEAIRKLEEAIEDKNKVIKIKDKVVFSIIGWSGIVCFGTATVLSFVFGEYLIGLGFAAFFGLSLYGLLSVGYIVIDNNSIIRKNYLGKYKMVWDEIKTAEFSAQNDVVVFTGDHKVLVISGRSAWGSQREEGHNYILGQIRSREIKTTETSRSMLRFSKGVTMKGDTP